MKRAHSKLKLVIVSGLIGLILWSNPWTHYQLAAFQDTISAYERFVQQFPESEYVPVARQRLNSLRKASGIPGSVQENATPELTDKQTAKESNHSEPSNVQSKPSLSEDSSWQAVKVSNDINQVRAYLRSYPKGNHAAEAKRAIVDAANTQWVSVAASRSEDEIGNFIKTYPESSHIRDAHLRIEKLRAEETQFLREDSSWQAAKVSNDVGQLREFLRSYPNGKYAAEAKRAIVDVADAQWVAIAESRSETAIARFIKAYPESTHIPDAEARIQKLYDDYDWVTNEGTLVAYRRYLQRNPNDSRRSTIERKIIDLEVAEIVAGDHGTLPAPQRLSSGSYSSFANTCIENGTSYELTVRFSGPDSKKIIIPAGEVNSLQLPVGAYTVAASVSAANVTNYVGNETLQGGEYSSRFYIRSSFGMPPSPQKSSYGNACQR